MEAEDDRKAVRACPNVSSHPSILNIHIRYAASHNYINQLEDLRSLRYYIFDRLLEPTSNRLRNEEGKKMISSSFISTLFFSKFGSSHAPHVWRKDAAPIFLLTNNILVFCCSLVTLSTNLL